MVVDAMAVEGVIIGIHDIHRQMARLVHLCTDQQENLTFGNPEIQLAFQLLRQNYQLVHRLDELKEQSFLAYLAGDHTWQHELEQQITEIEVGMIQRKP
jgi:DICT domain-containing protein